jgi:hypothetical protein
MFYVLKGWIKFVYEGEGEYPFNAGDCLLRPSGIVHNELDCSDNHLAQSWKFTRLPCTRPWR